MFSGITALQLKFSKRAMLLWVAWSAIVVLSVFGQDGMVSAQTARSAPYRCAT